MNRLKKYSFLGGVILITCIVVVYPYRGRIKHRIKSFLGYSTGGFGGGGSGYCPNCSTIFTDKVKVHSTAYLYDGIAPQKEDADLDKLSK